jgi:probable HAF family extracellular repeat protein
MNPLHCMVHSRLKQLGYTIAVLLAAQGQTTCQTRYKITDLGTFGGSFSNAIAIDPTGAVVGSAHTGSVPVTVEAYVWNGGALQPLAMLPGGVASFAGDIAGPYIAGEIDYPTTFHAMLWSSGSPKDLGTLGGKFSSALGVNSSGWVVGYSEIAGGANRAFLDTGSGMIDLGTLGGIHSFGKSINDVGIVVGSAMNALVHVHPRYCE